MGWGRWTGADGWDPDSTFFFPQKDGIGKIPDLIRPRPALVVPRSFTPGLESRSASARSHASTAGGAAADAVPTPMTCRTPAVGTSECRSRMNVLTERHAHQASFPHMVPIARVEVGTPSHDSCRADRRWCERDAGDSSRLSSTMTARDGTHSPRRACARCSHRARRRRARHPMVTRGSG